MKPSEQRKVIEGVFPLSKHYPVQEEEEPKPEWNVPLEVRLLDIWCLLIMACIFGAFLFVLAVSVRFH